MRFNRQNLPRKWFCLFYLYRDSVPHRDLGSVHLYALDERPESVKIDATLGGLGYPFDVIVISGEWFQGTK